jgi:hypothetical protein
MQICHIASGLFANEPTWIRRILGNHGKAILGAAWEGRLIFLRHDILGKDKIKRLKGRRHLWGEGLYMLEDEIEGNVCFNCFIILHGRSTLITHRGR